MKYILILIPLLLLIANGEALKTIKCYMENSDVTCIPFNEPLPNNVTLIRTNAKMYYKYIYQEIGNREKIRSIKFKPGNYSEKFKTSLYHIIIDMKIYQINKDTFNDVIQNLTSLDIFQVKYIAPDTFKNFRNLDQFRILHNRQQNIHQEMYFGLKSFNRGIFFNLDDITCYKCLDEFEDFKGIIIKSNAARPGHRQIQITANTCTINKERCNVYTNIGNGLVKSMSTKKSIITTIKSNNNEIVTTLKDDKEMREVTSTISIIKIKPKHQPNNINKEIDDGVNVDLSNKSNYLPLLIIGTLSTFCLFGFVIVVGYVVKRRRKEKQAEIDRVARSLLNN